MSAPDAVFSSTSSVTLSLGKAGARLGWPGAPLADVQPLPLGVDRPHPHLVDRLRRQPRDAGAGRRAGVGRVGPRPPDRGDGAGGAGPQPLLHVVARQRRLPRHHRRRPGHRQPVGRGTHRQIGGRVRRLGHVGDVDRQGDGVVPVRVGLARAVLAVPHLDHQGVGVPGRLEVGGRLEGQDPGAGHGEQRVVVGRRRDHHRGGVQPVGEIVLLRVGHLRRGHRRLVLRRVHRRAGPSSKLGASFRSFTLMVRMMESSQSVSPSPFTSLLSRTSITRV